MKNRTIFLFIFYVDTLVASSLIAMQIPVSSAPPTASTPVFNVNFSMNPQVAATTTVDLDNKASAIQNVQPLLLHNNQTPLLDALKDTVHKICTWPSGLPAAQDVNTAVQTNIQNFFTQYKWRIIGGSIVGSYVFLCYWIAKGNGYLGQSQLWSSWRQEMPLNQLLAIPQQQCAQDLIQEIRFRYMSMSNEENGRQPFFAFVQDINQEEEQLKWYQTMYERLSWLYITRIVPFSSARFLTIPERLSRLAYYKNLFKSWAITHNNLV